MKLKNVLIVVNDIEKSKKFYHDIFRLGKIWDNGGEITEEMRQDGAKGYVEAAESALR